VYVSVCLNHKVGCAEGDWQAPEQVGHQSLPDAMGPSVKHTQTGSVWTHVCREQIYLGTGGYITKSTQSILDM
jgi:hypothetical protein